MSGSNWKRYPGDRSYMKDHQLMAEPEEVPWCEDCGASMEFCSCNEPLDYQTDEEREEM